MSQSENTKSLDGSKTTRGVWVVIAIFAVWAIAIALATWTIDSQSDYRRPIFALSIPAMFVTLWVTALVMRSKKKK